MSDKKRRVSNDYQSPEYIEARSAPLAPYAR